MKSTALFFTGAVPVSLASIGFYALYRAILTGAPTESLWAAGGLGAFLYFLVAPSLFMLARRTKA